MKAIYRKFFLLMVPMALKELIAAFINLVDSIMLGKFGNNVIASVGICNQWYFLFTVTVFGICGGAGVFSAQYLGAKKTEEVKRVLGLSLLLVIIAVLIFAGSAFFIPEKIIGLFRNDAGVIESGVKYLKIVSVSYLFAGITSAYDMSLCCSGNAHIPFISRIAGLFVNLGLNFLLIYGNFGFPKMGTEGAAVATVIARATELTIILTWIYGRKLIQAATPMQLFKISKNMFFRYFKSALPVMINEGAWALGTTVYSWVFAQHSVRAVVIITIVQNIERLLLVFFHGGGNAVGIIVGKLVGAEKNDEAYLISKKLCLLNIVFSLLLSGAFMFARPFVLLPYDITPDIYDETMKILALMAGFTNIKSLTFLFIVGIFRNGGDTKAGIKMDASALWLIGVPLVMFGGLYLKLPVIYVYILMMSEDLVKLALCVPHFVKKKWIKNLVKE